MGRKLIPILILQLALLASASAQPNISVRRTPKKLFPITELLIPHGKDFIYEKYSYFKYVYWLEVTDTLKINSQNLLAGSRVNISPDSTFKPINACDTTVNKIRNSSLDSRTYSKLETLARKDIGYDNKEFEEGLRIHRPAAEFEKSTCHDDFKVINLNWLESQTARIDRIKDKKTQRLKWISANSALITKDFIDEFIKDYGAGDIDHRAILELIQKHPDNFLLACHGLDDNDFYVVQRKLADLPKELPREAAIAAIKESEVKTKRKRGELKS